MSKVRTLLISTGFAAAVFGAPAIALAAGEFHPGSGEKGVTQYPSHRVLNNERADVVAERNAAMQSKQQRFAPNGNAMNYPAPAATNGPGLSRADVERETVRAMRAGAIPMGEGS